MDKNSDEKKLTEKIHISCGLKVGNDEIAEVYKKPVRGNNFKLVIKYKNSDTKEKVQKAIRTKRLSTADLGFTTEKKAIFANESLSVYASHLFWQARTAKFEKKWQSVWTNRGKIYVRRELEGIIVNVKTIEELQILVT